MSDQPMSPELDLTIRDEWLPPLAGTSQLGLLHAVRRMLSHSKSSCFHPRGQSLKPKPPSSGSMQLVTPGSFFDDIDRLYYSALMLDLAFLRHWLPVYLESVGLPGQWGEIVLPDREGSALSGLIPERDGWTPFERETRQCLVRALTDLANWLDQSVRQNELPPGWESDASGALPLWPVRNLDELREHLKDLLIRIMESQTYPGNLDTVSRELRNTRRAMRKFIEDSSNRPVVNDTPKDIFDAERELERLIDLLDATQYNSPMTGIESAETPVQVNPLSVEPPVPEETREEEKLVLNDTCLRILDALDGRAMRVEEIAKVVTGGETSRLYRYGMKTILEANGLIVHDSKIGYFRPNAPPPERVAKVVKKDAKK